MAISIDSQSFRETAKKIEDLQSKGALDSAKAKQLIEEQGFDPVEFKETYNEYSGLTQEEKDKAAEITGLGIIDAPVRVAGRAIGEAGRDIASFSADVAPNLTKKISDNFSVVADTVGQYVPESVKEFSDELFDPYHGDGVYGTAEGAIGNIASYFVPATGILKATRGAHTLAKSNRFLNSGLKQASNLLGAKGRKATKVAGFLTTGAAAATIAEDPSENIVNTLREQFPESTEILEGLSVNPEDTRLQQRLNAFVNNLGFEVAAVGGIAGLIKGYNKVKPLGRKFEQLFSSTRGMSDKAQELFLGSDAAVSNAFKEATVDAKKLSKVMKDNNMKDPAQVQLVNDALQGDSVALENIPTDVKEVVTEMRNNIDELSTFFTKNERLSGQLATTVDNNLNTYLTKSYQAFEDPKYLQDMSDAIRRNEKNISMGRLDQITDEGLKKMTNYLVDDIGLEPNQAFNALKNSVQNLSPEETGNFLLDLANKNKGGQGTTGALKKRQLIPDPVKAFLGEIKDPTFNYVNSYKKLAAYKAEVNFLEELKKDMLNSGAAVNIAKAKGQDITNVPDAFVKAEDIVDERLSKVFGGGVVRKDAVKNPLSDLYIDPSYAKTLREGIDGMNPASSAFFKYAWIPLKTGSQIAVTVFNPITHARNVLGNVVFMTSNGMSPINGGAFDASKFVVDKLFGLNNKELTQQFNKYKSLGITGTDIASETIRKNLKDITLNTPEVKKNIIDNLYKKLPQNITKYTTKPLGKAAKKAIDKVIDVYQLEDDVFKIMHFEGTKKYLKEAFPNLTDDALESMAAQRTRDLMPNYKIAPAFIKSLRYMPIGDFATFAAESARVSKNLVKYTVKDALSGNATLSAAAAKRLAGMTAAGLGADYLSEQSKMFLGISDKEEEALKTIGPDWEYFAPQIYLDKKKVGEKKVYDTLSMASLDPFAFPKTVAKATHRMFFDPKISEQLLSGDIDKTLQPELFKVGNALFDSVLGPFIGTSLATDALLDAATGLKEDKPFGEVATKFLGDTLEPAVLDFYRKRKQYELELAAKDKELADKGYPSYTLFSERTKGIPGEADYGALLGVKTRRIDIDSSVPYNIGYRLKNMNRGKALSRVMKGDLPFSVDIKKRIREKTPIALNQINDNDFIEAKKTDEKTKLRLEQELRMYINAYRDLGYSDKDITKAMRRLKISKEGLQTLDAIQKNKHIPTDITKSDLENFYRGLKEKGVSFPLGKIREINKKLVGQKIDEELFKTIRRVGEK